jgi:hypothetical protein
MHLQAFEFRRTHFGVVIAWWGWSPKADVEHPHTIYLRCVLFVVVCFCSAAVLLQAYPVYICATDVLVVAYLLLQHILTCSSQGGARSVGDVVTCALFMACVTRQPHRACIAL